MILLALLLAASAAGAADDIATFDGGAPALTSYPGQDSQPTAWSLVTGWGGITGYRFTPAFIDRWIPRPATGNLGREILGWLADQSRAMNVVMVPAPPHCRRRRRACTCRGRGSIPTAAASSRTRVKQIARGGIPQAATGRWRVVQLGRHAMAATITRDDCMCGLVRNS